MKFKSLIVLLASILLINQSAVAFISLDSAEQYEDLSRQVEQQVQAQDLQSSSEMLNFNKLQIDNQIKDTTLKLAVLKAYKENDQINFMNAKDTMSSKLTDFSFVSILSAGAFTALYGLSPNTYSIHKDARLMISAKVLKAGAVISFALAVGGVITGLTFNYRNEDLDKQSEFFHSRVEYNSAQENLALQQQLESYLAKLSFARYTLEQKLKAMQ